MISILIPIYNFNCLRLVTDLQQQCEEVQAQFGAEVFSYEIIVADDAGTDESIIEKNELIELFPGCRYVRGEENVGRARVCNRLFDQAAYDFLLLIDADAEVCTDDFIQTYWQRREQADVLVGSIRTPDKAPAGHELRLKYEWAAEKIRTVEYRNKQPAAHFSTFNVMFARKVIESHRFDERCTEYGYEDALLGLTITENGFSILHIENPLLHTGINSNKSFLGNSETALRTLAKLGEPMTLHAHVAVAHRRLQTYGWAGIFALFFSLFAPLLKKNLLSRHPSLLLFKLYKLGYYDRVVRQH